MTAKHTLVAAAVVLGVAGLSGCAATPPGAGETTMTTAPSVEHQGDAAEAFVTSTMSTSGVAWTASDDASWTQDCVLDGGDRGALVNLTRVGGGLVDPESVRQQVGKAWEQDGLRVTYSEDTYNDGSARYVVRGVGGPVSSIEFGVGAHRSTISAVSHCGTGDAAADAG